MKWGEYASEVQLILRKSTPEGNKNTALANPRSVHTNRVNKIQNSLAEHSLNNSLHENIKASPTIGTDSDDVQSGLERNRDIRKSLTFSGLHGNISEVSPEVNNIT
jgi:Ras association domain-containing protein 7/8